MAPAAQASAAGPWWRLAHSYRYKPLSHRIAMHLGPLRMRREIGNIQAALVADGLARWLEPGTIAAASAELLAPAQADEQAGSLAARELAATATAVRRLLTGR